MTTDRVFKWFHNYKDADVVGTLNSWPDVGRWRQTGRKAGAITDMKVSIIAVGRRPPSWARTGFEEYAKRLPPHLSPKSIMIDNRSRGHKRQQVARHADAEGEKMLQAAGDAYLVVLDRGGHSIATEDVARALSQWQMDGRDIAFLIGGAEGLAPAVIDRADQVWSLSNMVFAHQLVRLLLVEQLYRGWSINEGIPYHRGDAVKAVRRTR